MKFNAAVLLVAIILCLELVNAGKKKTQKSTEETQENSEVNTEEKGTKNKKNRGAMQCNPPFWHAKWGLNSLGSHLKAKDYPKFKLSVKGYDKTFETGQRYKVLLESQKGKKNPKINGVYFTLDASEECTATGKFPVGGTKVMGKKALATKQCKTMAILNDKPDQSFLKVITVWIAPKEIAKGCTITMRATVMATDRNLYYDGEYEEADYQHLTITLTPSQS